ncbi:MAG: PBP1A family penicillin-binding protein [Pseudomonadota bacterium]
MQDPLKQSRRRRRLPGLLEIDAAIDSGLFRAGEFLKRTYGAFSARMERFTVRGVTRVFNEMASEAFTLGTAGAVVALAFAVPAFDETRSEDWRSAQEYSVTFFDRFGNPIGNRGVLHDDRVPLEDIPDHMIKATLATEDRRFFQHFGIDVFGTFRAILENARAGGVVQGGSSITQQLAKNVFLSNERTIERKIKEAFLSVWLEVRLSKNEILKLYLDRAYMGGGTIGVEAASQFYFDKSVRDVTLAEAAMLAGLFKAPGRFAPHLDLPAARARANVVLDNLVDAGFMTEGQVFGARRSPATSVDVANRSVPDYFLDYAFEEVKKLANGEDFILEVKTTFDSSVQRVMDTVVEANVRQYAQGYGADGVGMVVMEPEGAVRGIVGGRDYGESQFNRATQAMRQPGSSFKAYVYITALINGYTPNSIVVDAPICIGRWCPGNYSGGYSGRQSLTRAFARSVNTIPVRLTQDFGREAIIETMERMGVETPMRNIRSMELGASELTVLDQVAGYSVFANGGYRATPHAILEMRNTTGEVVYDRAIDAPPRERIFPPQKVTEMNSLLYAVTTSGTGRRAQIPNVATAGKTGTSQAYRDAWFVGFTGNYVGAVWFGNDDFTSTRRMTGGSLPAMTWQAVMAEIHKGIDIRPIPGITGPADAVDAEVAEAAAAAEERRARLSGLSDETVSVLRGIADSMRSTRLGTPTAEIDGSDTLDENQRDTSRNPAETGTSGDDQAGLQVDPAIAAGVITTGPVITSGYAGTAPRFNNYRDLQ